MQLAGLDQGVGSTGDNKECSSVGNSCFVKSPQYSRTRHLGIGQRQDSIIDHFYGLESCWKIPATFETAVEGRWVPAPREALLIVLHQSLAEFNMSADIRPLLRRQLWWIRSPWPGSTL